MGIESLNAKILVFITVGISICAGVFILYLKGEGASLTIENYGAYSITTTGATLWADYDVRSRSSVGIRFEFKENSSDVWQHTDWHETTGSGRFSKTIGGLDPNTRYELRVVLQYNSSVLASRVRMFETLAIPPTIKTLWVTDVDETSAVINVSYDSGSYPEIDIQFSYKGVGENSKTTGWTTVSGSGEFSENISNLTPAMVYQVQTMVRHDNTIHSGSVEVFQTPQLLGQPSVPNYEAVGNVTTVTDGDTISVYLTWVNKNARRVDAGSFEPVRFAGGIDAPEIGREEGAEEAKRFVADLSPPGTEVLLDLDDSAILGIGPYRDLHGRLLAAIYVRRDNIWVNVNAELLRWGLKEYPRNNWLEYISFKSEFDPNDWLADDYPYVL